METTKKYHSIPELVKAELAGEIGRKEYEVMVQAMIQDAAIAAEKRIAAAKAATANRPTKALLVEALIGQLMRGEAVIPCPEGMAKIALSDAIKTAIVGSPSPTAAVWKINQSGWLREWVRLDSSTFGDGASKMRVVSDKKAGLVATSDLRPEDALVLIAAQKAIDGNKGMAPQRLSDGSVLSVGKGGSSFTFWKAGVGVLPSHDLSKRLQLPA